MLTLTLLSAGLVLVSIGRKQRAGTLRRNRIAGLRTWETMRSDEAWHAAHSATAGTVILAGSVQLVAGAVLLIVRPEGDLLPAIVLAGAGLTLVLVVAAGVRGHRIAARVNRAAR